MTNVNSKTSQILVPAVDIVETGSAYVVTLDIPGADKGKIKAQVEEATLTVTAPVAGIRHDKELSESAPEYRREFSLASDVDVQSIGAAYDLGVLTITLKKKAQFLPKEITIN